MALSYIFDQFVNHILVASLTLMALSYTYFINVSYHILAASLTLMALSHTYFINVSYHILVASLTLMAVLKQSYKS